MSTFFWNSNYTASDVALPAVFLFSRIHETKSMCLVQRLLCRQRLFRVKHMRFSWRDYQLKGKSSTSIQISRLGNYPTGSSSYSSECNNIFSITPPPPPLNCFKTIDVFVLRRNPNLNKTKNIDRETALYLSTSKLNGINNCFSGVALCLFKIA